ncbi:hypothetical protein BH20VER3_BH20VER3_13370 [soil metagenome]
MLHKPAARKGQARAKREAGAARIVLVDQEPLRERVAADCSEAMMALEQARACWRHFEHKDKPAFNRWRAREFGALLSRAREVETQIRDCQALVHEVEMEMRRLFQPPWSAYQRVMFRRAKRGAETGEEEPPPVDPTHGPARKLSEFEQEALFQEWVKSSLGTNPDKMDDEAYSTTFEAFKSHMFRGPAEEFQPQKPTSGPERPRPSSPQDSVAGVVPEEKIDLRIKELYRRLVRRLHPDLRADGSAVVSALWHEVQEAYAAGDVARLEILLALSDIETKRTAEQSLSQMHALRTELERSVRALGKSLGEAEGEEAWDFARLGPNAGLKARVERQLKTDLAARTRRLDLLARTVTEWAQGPTANPIVLVRR